MKNRSWALVAAVALPTVLAACQVQWVSAYDEQTDRNVTAYQEKMNVFFEELKDSSWPACSYESNTDFYAEASADATVILTRAQSIQKNSQTIRQTQALKDNLGEVRTTHRDSDEDEDCLSEDYVTLSQGFMNQVVRAILWLELGKKRQLGSVSKDDQLPATTLPDSMMPTRE